MTEGDVLNWLLTFAASFIVGAGAAGITIATNRRATTALVLAVVGWSVCVLPIIIWGPR